MSKTLSLSTTLFVNFSTPLLKSLPFFKNFSTSYLKSPLNLTKFNASLLKTMPFVYILIRSFSKELSSEAIDWIFSFGLRKVIFIVIYMLFENHLQKHIVKRTFFDDHVQNTQSFDKSPTMSQGMLVGICADNGCHQRVPPEGANDGTTIKCTNK